MKEMFKSIIFNTTFKVVLIRFEQSVLLYSFLTPIKDLKRNDYVITHTVRGFQIGKFIRYTKDKQDVKMAKDYAFQKVDKDIYEKLKRR